MSCKSADGSDPIHYKWERVLDRGKFVSKLPPLALIGKSSHSHICLPLSSSFKPVQTIKIPYKQDTAAK